MNNVLKQLLNGVLINPEQPYIIYFRYGKDTYKNSKDYDNAINENTNFRLASVTKQFIAYGIISLVDDGKLAFETTIDQIYPELPLYFQAITIKQLLNHTSGILDYEEFLEKDYQEHQLLDKDILDFLKNTDHTYFAPGAKYRYSNTAYILLGLIISKISGKTISAYLDNLIFKPLKMDLSLVNIQGKTKIPNRALGHIIKDGKIVMQDQYWCSATIGDGGIYSNVTDLIKWLEHLKANYNKLSNTMFNRSIKTGPNSFYGMGMRIVDLEGGTIYTHSGSTIGTNTLIAFSLDFDFELIFLTNLGPTETDKIRENLYMLIEKKN